MTVKEQVRRAIEVAFAVKPNQVNDDGLVERSGRVFGDVIVAQSDAFDGMAPSERTRRLWDEIRKQMGADAVKVGVVMLRSAGS